MGLGAGSRQPSGWVLGAIARSQSSGLSQPPRVPGGCGESGLSPERSGDGGVAELADLGNKGWGGVLQVSSAGKKPPWLPGCWTPRPRWGEDSVMAACPSAECLTHEWGVGVGGTQGWTSVLVDLM